MYIFCVYVESIRLNVSCSWVLLISGIIEKSVSLISRIFRFSFTFELESGAGHRLIPVTPALTPAKTPGWEHGYGFLPEPP